MLVFVHKYKGELALLCGSFFFAITFVLEKYCLENVHVGPYFLNALLHAIAASFQFACKPFFLSLHGLDQEKEVIVKEHAWGNSKYLWGYLFGLTKFIASTVGFVGLQRITAGESAFLTSLYIMFTPILHTVTDRYQSCVSLRTWVCVLLSCFGSFLLTNPGSMFSSAASESSPLGEALTVFAAFVWAIYILAVDAGSKVVNFVELASLGTTIAAIHCIALAIVVDRASFYNFFTYASATDITIVVLAGLAESLAYTCATLGQSYTSSSRTALLMSLDSVFTAIIAFFCLDETLSLVQSAGCFLMLSSSTIASAESAKHHPGDQNDHGSASILDMILRTCRIGDEAAVGTDTETTPLLN